MELIKNIFFNTDKIVENSKLKISYVGSLYQNGAEEVFLHYGFGLQWDNVSEIKMEKTELGFQCEIEVGESESLNLCFRDNENRWDNNEGQNYIFPVEKCEEKEESDISLTLIDNSEMQVHKGLRKSYIFAKKIKIAFYKAIRFFPKIISGNFKKSVNE